MEGGYDFPFLGAVSSNIRLKWLSICLNIDYEAGTMELYLNGEKREGRQRANMTVDTIRIPAFSHTIFMTTFPQMPSGSSNPLIVRLGRHHFDDTPLIGRMFDFNMWDR